MRKLTLSLLFLTLIIGYCGIGNAQEKYKSAIDDILASYPEATLQDIYKSFFQDRFGPEHIISDTVSVRNYLINELQNMGETAMPYFEPTGTGENFIRVSLQTVKDSLVSGNELLFLFIESANSKKEISVSEWKVEWDSIKNYVPKDLRGYALDSERIDSVLSLGQYAIHHSKIYNELYHPHYRIIRKDLFKDKLLPKIAGLGN